MSVRINLLPWRAHHRTLVRRMIFACFVVFGLGGVVFMAHTHHRLSQRIEKEKEELAWLSNQVAQLQAQEKTEKQIKVLEAWQSHKEKTRGLLSVFVQKIPEDIEIENVERQDEKWVIEGQASSREPIVEWVRSLKPGPNFQSVHLSSLSTDDTKFFHFRIRAQQGE